MLPTYIDYILVHPRQKVRLRPDLSPKFLSALGPNPAQPDPKSPARLTSLVCVQNDIWMSPDFPMVFPTHINLRKHRH